MLVKNASMFLRNTLNTGKCLQVVRHFSVTSAKYDIVKIQSTDDFKAKVINSKVPVVVDFFAT